MDLLTGLGIYLIVATGISLTAYLQIFKPAVFVLENQILEKSTPYSGTIGFIVWMGFSIVVAPWTLFLLLQNDNKKLIEGMASKLSESFTEDE